MLASSFHKQGFHVKEIILSSGIGFGIGALFTLCRIPIPAPNVLPGVLSIVFMYIGYLVVKSIFY
nr:MULTISPECIES: DUF1427 family protein [Citrobacter]